MRKIAQQYVLRGVFIFLAAICFSVAYSTSSIHAAESDSNAHPTGGFREIEVTDCYDLNNGTMWTPAYDGRTFRFGATDTSAVYWRVNLPVVDDENSFFRLRGEYPNAAYFSYHVNGEDTRYISHITDFEIRPDPGSANHFAAGNDKTDIGVFEPGNYYTLDIIDSKDQPKKENVVYGGYVNGEERVRYNVLMYRIYEPASYGDGRYADIELPRLYYVTDDIRTTKKDVCGMITDAVGRGKISAAIIPIENRILDKTAAILAASADQETPGYYPADPITWIMGDNFFKMIGYAFPIIPDGLEDSDVPTGANMDSRYVSAFLDPTEEITLLKFKVPEVGKDVRYGSVCMIQPFNGLMYTWDCSRYYQLHVEGGYATIVFSTPENKPEGACSKDEWNSDCRYDWLQYGSRVPLVWIRQLVPSDDFKESLLCYDGKLVDVDAIEAHMGAYYPDAWYCSREDFETLGAESCRDID